MNKPELKSLIREYVNQSINQLNENNNNNQTIINDFTRQICEFIKEKAHNLKINPNTLAQQTIKAIQNYYTK